VYTNLIVNIPAIECECALGQARVVVAWHMSVFMFGQLHVFASRNANALQETQIAIVSVRATDFCSIQRTNHSSYFHVTLTLSGHEAGTLTTTTHQITPTKAHV
jgi:hypothetical protein